MNLNKTVVDNIYNKFKENIINLEIELGSRINIQKISEEFCISHIAIREALGRLVNEGLVLYKPRKGYYIIQLTCIDLEEIYDLRKMIECYALKKGMEKIDKSKLKELLDMGIKMQKEPLEPKKPAKFCSLDKELHMVIVKSCLSLSMNRIYSQIYPLVSISQQLDPLYKRSMREHIVLIKEILKGNKSKAKDILEKHIEHCKNDGIKSLYTIYGK